MNAAETIIVIHPKIGVEGPKKTNYHLHISPVTQKKVTPPPYKGRY